MGWREQLLISLGPGNFSGISLGDFWSLLRENGFHVSPSCLPRVASILAMAAPNTVLRRFESLIYHKRCSAMSIPPPIFVLGHYRQGTTHLHNLLSIDRRFAFPTMYQASYPHTFLTTEGVTAKLANFFLPSKRPFDNVRMGLDVPFEDEMAMIIAARISPYLSGVFPRRAVHYDRHLTFRDASDAEVRQWQEALIFFFKKLTFKYDRPLIIKSPPHTARIRMLLEMFPQAKFVHIHRNPIEVFNSTIKMLTKASPWVRLQSDRVDWADRTIRVYREMYDAFFAERALIPSGHFCEVGYEDISANPRQELRKIYEELSLPDFSEVEADLGAYLDSISSYERNRFPALTDSEAENLRTAWHRNFKAWGYRLP